LDKNFWVRTLVRIDISKTHEPAFGCNHYSRALVVHLTDRGRIVSPSHVGGGGTIDVVEELRLHSIHALAVVPSGHRYAQDQPKNEADAGKEEASGEAGRAGGIEVEDGAGAVEDLAERLEVGRELQDAGRAWRGIVPPDEARAR
jgi:hypothetical protein